MKTKKSLTIEEKYKWLLDQLEITDVDYWEKDATLKLYYPLYFQFSDYPGTVDECIEAAIRSERQKL